MIRGGQANFFRNPQIAITQILGLISLPHIRKLLRSASPQIANPQLFVFTNYCKTQSQNSPKICLFKMISGFCKNLNYSVICYTCKENKYVFANYKKGLGPKIANLQTATFAEGSQICGFAICGTYLRTAQFCI
jgi:hypothetical protein